MRKQKAKTGHIKSFIILKEIVTMSLKSQD